MLIVCPSCDAQYNVPESAIPPEGREVQCSSCQNVWHQAPAAALASGFIGADTAQNDASQDNATSDQSDLAGPEDAPALETPTKAEPAAAKSVDDGSKPDEDLAAQGGESDPESDPAHEFSFDDAENDADQPPDFGPAKADEPVAPQFGRAEDLADEHSAADVEIIADLRADRGTRLRGDTNPPTAESPKRDSAAASTPVGMFRVPPPPPDITEESLPQAPVFSEPPTMAGEADNPFSERPTEHKSDDSVHRNDHDGDDGDQNEGIVPGAAAEPAGHRPEGLQPEDEPASSKTVAQTDLAPVANQADSIDEHTLAKHFRHDAHENEIAESEKSGAEAPDVDELDSPFLADGGGAGFVPVQPDPPHFQRSAHPQLDAEAPAPRPWVADDGDADNDGFSFEAKDNQRDEPDNATADNPAEDLSVLAANAAHESDDGGFVWEEAEDEDDFPPSPEPEDLPAPVYTQPTSGHPEPPATSGAAKAQDPRAARKLTDAIAELKTVQKFAPKPASANPVPLDQARRARNDEGARPEIPSADSDAAAPDEEALLANIRSELLRSKSNAGRSGIEDLRASLLDNGTGRRAKAAKPSKGRTPTKERGKGAPGRRSGRLGLVVALVLFGLLALVYLQPQTAIALLPGSQGTITDFVGLVDTLRASIAGLVGG